MPVDNAALDCTGTWICRYWFHNTKHDNREDTSEYRVQIEKHDGGYVFHSLPNTGELEGSHMEGRFTIDGVIVMGTFMENTAPSGEWEGMTYKGAFQLLMNDDGTHMEGMRVTTAYNNGNPKVTTGRWEMVRV